MAPTPPEQVCHVDIAGDTEANRNMCILLNEVGPAAGSPRSLPAPARLLHARSPARGTTLHGLAAGSSSGGVDADSACAQPQPPRSHSRLPAPPPPRRPTRCSWTPSSAPRTTLSWTPRWRMRTTVRAPGGAGRGRACKRGGRAARARRLQLACGWHAHQGGAAVKPRCSVAPSSRTSPATPAGYTGEPLSRWCANSKMGKNSDPNEDRAVFVVGGGCRGCVGGRWEAAWSGGGMTADCTPPCQSAARAALAALLVVAWRQQEHILPPSSTGKPSLRCPAMNMPGRPHGPPGPPPARPAPPCTPAQVQDEQTCIGCKQCVWCAPATFRIESDYGRSRVFGQWLDKEDDIQVCVCVWLWGGGLWAPGRAHLDGRAVAQEQAATGSRPAGNAFNKSSTGRVRLQLCSRQ